MREIMGSEGLFMLRTHCNQRDCSCIRHLKKWHVVLGVSFWVMGLLPSEVGPAYPSAMFTPAMPGNTPNCVKDPRDTYCTEPKKYPKERIVYLLENKMYDLDSLLTDETRDSYTFEARDIPNLPLNMYSYDAPKQSYGPPKPSPGYLPPRQNYTTTSKPGYVPPPSTKYGPPPSHFYDQPTPSRGIVRSGSLRRQKRQTTTDLCPYESEYIMPRAALNNKGDWMFLVNVNEVSSEYTQLVESKKCITNTCTGSCNVPDGFTAVCQQQYVQKRLIALDGSGSRLATDTFWFPSCCVCKLNPSGG
ncbi:protein spaetzle 5-like isoform X3 [Macrobrachium nipponense]|uniref:protein spaetzle 5-like isoform X3 n=1 Tax=Macrobrachium nipponense TaxID=159736 RepID=UPI0030C83F9D